MTFVAVHYRTTNFVCPRDHVCYDAPVNDEEAREFTFNGLGTTRVCNLTCSARSPSHPDPDPGPSCRSQTTAFPFLFSKALIGLENEAPGASSDVGVIRLKFYEVEIQDEGSPPPEAFTAIAPEAPALPETKLESGHLHQATRVLTLFPRTKGFLYSHRRSDLVRSRR
jgi:hypothetical protein